MENTWKMYCKHVHGVLRKCFNINLIPETILVGFQLELPSKGLSCIRDHINVQMVVYQGH